MSVNRKAQYRLYPKSGQLEDIERIADVARWCYNSALADRIWMYREWGKSLNFSGQCRDLKALRESKPEWQAVHTHILQVSLKRLDLAFGHFFRRVKSGDTPGFPRFKSRHRPSGFGLKEHGNGWKITLSQKGGILRIHGVGDVKFRGRSRHDHGKPKTVEVFERGGHWFASVTWQCEVNPVRASGQEQVGIDWGVETFATVAGSDGNDYRIENPRHLAKSQAKLKRLQRKLSRARRGSKNRKKVKALLVRTHAKVANQRKDFCHQSACRIVATSSHIGVEKLDTASMLSSSPKGSAKAAARGLHRSITDATPHLFHSILKCKAEEAGIPYVEVDPLKHKPSQTCSVSALQAKKTLAQRMHRLPDGSLIPRDLNAARVILLISLGWIPTRAGWEPCQVSATKVLPFVAHETSPILLRS